MKNNNQNIIEAKNTFVICDVGQTLLKTHHFKSIMPIRELGVLDNQSKFITKDMFGHTKIGLPISKRDDMQDKKMQKVRIHFRSGRNSVKNMAINVPFADHLKNLLKTILSHYHWVERIISTIFNHFVETVIVENGRIFNIYENKELLK